MCMEYFAVHEYAPTLAEADLSVCQHEFRRTFYCSVEVDIDNDEDFAFVDARMRFAAPHDSFRSADHRSLFE